MVTATNVRELRELRDSLQGSVGFVPTMGALHRGHLSLILRAKEENDHVIVSIFVNPTQFLPHEDFTRYPRKMEADVELCLKAGTTLLFTPEVSDLYFADEPTLGAPPITGYILEGHARPGHYSGVLQVVLKLLHLTRPNRAYFGKKDAQQLVLIQKMKETLFLPTQIVPCETVREPDGLALSSRNIYLSKEERAQALLLSRALKSASKAIMGGELRSSVIESVMTEVLSPLRTDYIAITDLNLSPIPAIIEDHTLLLVAAHVGETRLIDSFWV